MTELLTDEDYCTIKKEPMGKVQRMLCKLLKETNWPAEIQSALTSKAAHTPHMYGVWKIHKLNCTLYLIVNTIGSPIYNTATYWVGLPKTFIRKTEYHLSNSKMFVEALDSGWSGQQSFSYFIALWIGVWCQQFSLPGLGYPLYPMLSLAVERCCKHFFHWLGDLFFTHFAVYA